MKKLQILKILHKNHTFLKIYIYKNKLVLLYFYIIYEVFILFLYHF